MENMRGWFSRGGLSFGSHPCQPSLFLLLAKPTTNSASLGVHSPAHAQSLAATFRGNFTLQTVRSDAMQAVVLLAELLGWGCVCAVPQ